LVFLLVFVFDFLCGWFVTCSSLALLCIFHYLGCVFLFLLFVSLALSQVSVLHYVDPNCTSLYYAHYFPLTSTCLLDGSDANNNIIYSYISCSNDGYTLKSFSTKCTGEPNVTIVVKPGCFFNPIDLDYVSPKCGNHIPLTNVTSYFTGYSNMNCTGSGGLDAATTDLYYGGCLYYGNNSYAAQTCSGGLFILTQYNNSLCNGNGTVLEAVPTGCSQDYFTVICSTPKFPLSPTTGSGMMNVIELFLLLIVVFFE